ncbi:unnamed protein product [Didymodactylos carnosus]|uniref:Uncharacterized protein n=1 Tax=Didymodactylos carnosus TaxID=1234261 RepID=A0A815W1E8_9BILA|nr:unnamed protein product [Didymodactylos carnosus]CAF1607190.1 unnamed protein product [Didymodactylos carnosus]CAF4396026.1 unnamed protein product [Didymodactylos carnosus]CAF4418923.1 unnamed protein product [Didymodactylos carnosus]
MLVYYSIQQSQMRNKLKSKSFSSLIPKSEYQSLNIKQYNINKCRNENIHLDFINISNSMKDINERQIWNNNLETVENLLEENAQFRIKLESEESKLLRLKYQIETLLNRINFLEDEIDTYEQETSDLRQKNQIIMTK